MERPRRPSFAPLLRNLGLASACIVVGLAIVVWRGRAPNETAFPLTQAKKYYREFEALFPNQLQAIVFDDQGARLMLADKSDVPNSPPVYLTICGPRGCQSFVTFSASRFASTETNATFWWMQRAV